MTHNVYLPIVHGGGTKPKIHSFQVGWDNEDRVEQYQNALGLQNGFDQHLLGDYPLITVQIEEWYTWYNLTYGGARGVIEPHLLTYSKATRTFPREAEAIAWIQAHPGKSYIIGNEPDGDLSEGNEANTMSVDEYVDFYHKASVMIRTADPTAKIILGAWAGGVGEYPLPEHNEQEFMSRYLCRYMDIPDIDGFSFHVYQHDKHDNPYPANKLDMFCSYVDDWYRNGWTLTRDVYLTEFGFYGPDPAGTTENCRAFMDWYIPYLRQHEQVKGYWWWEWALPSMLVIDGQATELGLYYKGLEE